MRQVPTQSVTVEPNRDVIEYAEEMCAKIDDGRDREAYIEECVIDSIKIEVDLESV